MCFWCRGGAGILRDDDAVAGVSGDARGAFHGRVGRDACEHQGVDAAVLAEIQRYTKLFWLNNGPYNNLTARKFVLKITPQQLGSAVDAV